MKLGLTGPIGCGKSTWVRAELARRGVDPASLAGFATRWRGGRGRGVLELCDWRGNVLWSAPGPFSCLAPLAGEFCSAARAVLDAAPPGAFLAVDELGILEAGDPALQCAATAALARAGGALAVVQERALAAWRDALPVDAWRRFPPLPALRV